MNITKNRDEVITYSINKNINNGLSIAVQGGEVTVMAPRYFTQNRIQEIVEEKRTWILKKIKEYESSKMNDFMEEYKSDKQVKLLGKNYGVVLKYKMISYPKISLENNLIKIIVPNKYKKINSEDLLNSLLNKMYNLVADKEIERVMEKVRIMVGYAPEDFKLCNMKNILGKCSENKIIYINPEIVKYNRNAIEYIVLHEYCHLKYKNHTKKFYSEIEKYIPNYEEYKSLFLKYKY